MFKTLAIIFGLGAVTGFILRPLLRKVETWLSEEALQLEKELEAAAQKEAAQAALELKTLQVRLLKLVSIAAIITAIQFPYNVVKVTLIKAYQRVLSFIRYVAAFFKNTPPPSN